MTGGSPSIYAFTRAKLAGHCRDDPSVLSDLNAVVLFVRLERARRSADFDSVVRAVERIGAHFREVGKPWLVVYAYAYLLLSPDASRRRPEARIAGGTYTVTYRDAARYRTHRILTDMWAQHHYERLSPHFQVACERARASED